MSVYRKTEGYKEQQSDYHKEYRKKNKEKLTQKKKEYYEEHKDKITLYKKDYYEKNKEEISEEHKEYYQEHKDYISEKNKNNKERKIYQKEYRENNPEKIKELNKTYRKINKEELTLKRKEREKKNKHIKSWRRLLERTLKYFGTKKEKHTIELLGYSADDLKQNMESKFTVGMSWSNYPEWHIDHIRPLSSFPKDTDPAIVNSLDNLQPLWKEDNLKKGSKYKPEK